MSVPSYDSRPTRRLFLFQLRSTKEPPTSSGMVGGSFGHCGKATELGFERFPDYPTSQRPQAVGIHRHGSMAEDARWRHPHPQTRRRFLMAPRCRPRSTGPQSSSSSSPPLWRLFYALSLKGRHHARGYQNRRQARLIGGASVTEADGPAAPSARRCYGSASSTRPPRASSSLPCGASGRTSPPSAVDPIWSVSCIVTHSRIQMSRHHRCTNYSPNHRPATN